MSTRGNLPYPTSGVGGKRTPEQSLASVLRRRYNLTIDEYNRMVGSQNGACAICKEKSSGKGPSNSRLHVDHCHTSGNNRGLLCRRCNTLLGMANDDVDRLKSAIKYLEEFRCAV